MVKRVSKSKTFAVILTPGNALGVYFICKKTEEEDGASSTFLDIQSLQTHDWTARDRNQVIELLKFAGLTVRYYDAEESQWMDDSRSYGLTRAPGSREGTWGPPTSIEEFQEYYLDSL